MFRNMVRSTADGTYSAGRTLRESHGSRELNASLFHGILQGIPLEDVHAGVHLLHRSCEGRNQLVADALSRLCPDFMHTDAESERHDTESVDINAAFWTAKRWSPSCAVLEELVEAEGQQPDPIVDADTFRINRFAHSHEVGHHGVERTILKLRKMQHAFPRMRARVKQFVDACPFCQKMSRLSPALRVQPFTVATYRFAERFDIDTVGPLPKDDFYALRVRTCRHLRFHAFRTFTSDA
jgi:hypothetical protein